MENQHRKITGYRELNYQEIDLMNKVKALGVEIESILKDVEAHTLEKKSQTTNTDLSIEEREKLLVAIENATPERFLTLAKTEFQTGLMYATRAVAQPEFF